MDYTYSNTGHASQEKTVPSAILKTFYSGAIESVLTQCGMETPPIRTAKLCRELCA